MAHVSVGHNAKNVNSKVMNKEVSEIWIFMEQFAKN